MSLLLETPCDHGECPYEAECYGNCEYWCGAEEPQDDPEVLWEDEEYEDTQGVVGPDSYRTHETLIKAMDAAGWWFNEMESHDSWLWFHGDYSNMSFDSWKDVEDWLNGVVFDDPEVSDAVEKIMDE